jgi:pimeloyl-ACP methyl ester carboxylesterase
MPMKTCNGTELYYELSGDGAPLVLVHGGWIDAKSWELVVPAFAEHFQVLAYDRRGHSRSRRPGAGSRRHDEDDLIALLDALDLAPAHLVGNSFGAAIVLAVAGRRPDLVRSVVAHEPPLVGVATAGSQLGALTDPVLATMRELVDLVRIGEREHAAQRFVEEVALGPGSWPILTEEIRLTMVTNAATLVPQFDNPDWAVVPAPTVVPTLLTDGELSPAWLPAITRELAATAYRHAARHTFAGAGHVPHLTHAAEHAQVAMTFAATASLVTVDL